MKDNMVIVKLCVALVVISCLGCWCQGDEQAELRFIGEGAPLEFIVPRSRSGHTRGDKRHSSKPPSVHIENIFAPQQTQNSGGIPPQGFNLYPGYPGVPQFYVLPDNSDIIGKPQTVATDPNAMPAETNATATSTQSPAQPSQVPNGQGNSEQSNGYVAFPYPITNQQNFLASLLASTGGSSPYFLIINSPPSLGQNIQKPPMTPAPLMEESADESSEEDIEESYNAQLLNSLPVPQPSKIKESQSTKKDSKENVGNLGLSLAKYLLTHPLYADNDKPQGSGRKTAMDEIVFKSPAKPDGLDVQSNIEDYVPEADELTTKDVKLPFQFLWALQNPQKKVDDRVALVYLRHTKKGRNMQLKQ